MEAHMTSIEFEPFAKIARLNRNITITEKIDGTNGCIVITHSENLDGIQHIDKFFDRIVDSDARKTVAKVGPYVVMAQSRNRFITPKGDNCGFAGWVERNAEALVRLLGAGRHYGEWWGAGIQSKYGLAGADKRFSLFDTKCWGGLGSELFDTVPGLSVVPVLYEGVWDQQAIDDALTYLDAHGSVAAPGFMRPEGIVVYHAALRSSFKVTLHGDAAPKGAAGHALDNEKVAA